MNLQINIVHKIVHFNYLSWNFKSYFKWNIIRSFQFKGKKLNVNDIAEISAKYYTDFNLYYSPTTITETKSC